MKTFAASALIALSGLFGTAYVSAATADATVVAHFSSAGSSGSNGTGDHMAGQLTNKDQVTSGGPNLGTGALQNAERAATGF